MEYVAGETLDRRIASGPIPEPDVVRLGLQLAEGLAAAHAAGVIHRDLKPGNLRITAENRLKILDFGLATLRANPSTTTGETTRTALTAEGVFGTLPYMAPEQLQGTRTDGRTDLYAAGVVLYEMATGRHPFAAARGAQLVTAILTQTPPAPRALAPGISAALERIIRRASEKGVGDRYQSAQQMAADLECLAAGKALAPGTARRARRTAALGAGALVAALVAGAVLWHGLLRPPRIEALAVLPLANLSGDPEQEYFADGMTDQLISAFSQMAGLERVISRTSVMRYKGARKSATCATCWRCRAR